MALNNDLPTLGDKLNWASELQRMKVRLIECKTPHVMGIHGDWGSGKTSFMRQLQYHLGGSAPDDGSVDLAGAHPIDPDEKKDLNSRIVTIWFDAWRYQNEPVPIVALLQEMRQQMSLAPAVLENLKKLGNVAINSILGILPAVGKAIGVEGLPSGDKVRQYGEQWERDNFATVASADSIRNCLLGTIDAVLPGDGSRIVIFIDDLDRCNPKTAMRLLEGLKIYMSLPKCVFVIGMNERVLVDAISEEVSAGTEDARLRAGHYLEKICTDIFRLPLPGSPCALLLKWLMPGEEANSFFLAVEGSACLPPNPRKLKALANQWACYSSRIEFPTDPNERKVWAVRALVAAYIHQFHRDIWERWHFWPDFWVDIKAWCCGEADAAQSGVTADSPLPDSDWRKHLALPERIGFSDDPLVPAATAKIFHNPGDINVFWIGSLIYAYRQHLNARDFVGLLKVG